MNKTDLTQYIPHRDHMILIDEIVNSSKESFCTRVNITEHDLLYSLEGVPSYCAIEYMAQSIAVYNSMHYGDRSASKIGFIVAMRAVKLVQAYFKNGEVLDIFIEPVLIVNNSGTFNCKIMIEQKEIATARITAYVPTDNELTALKERLQ